MAKSLHSGRGCVLLNFEASNPASSVALKGSDPCVLEHAQCVGSSGFPPQPAGGRRGHVRVGKGFQPNRQRVGLRLLGCVGHVPHAQSAHRSLQMRHFANPRCR